MALKVRCRNRRHEGVDGLPRGPVYRVVAHGPKQSVNNKGTDRLCFECAKANCDAYLGWGWAFTCEVTEEVNHG